MRHMVLHVYKFLGVCFVNGFVLIYDDNYNRYVLLFLSKECGLIKAVHYGREIYYFCVKYFKLSLEIS